MTAASLRDAAGLRAAAVSDAAVLVAVSAPDARVLRAPVLLDDGFFSTDLAAGALVVRAVRPAVLFAAVFRAGALAARRDGAEAAVFAVVARLVVFALAAGSDFAGRPDVLRAVAAPVLVRLAAARAAVGRGAAGRPDVREGVARFFAAGAALARVVFLAVDFAALFAAAGFVERVAAGFVAFDRAAGALAAAVDLEDARAGLSASFFAAADRAAGVAPLRIVRAVAPRALVPAVRRLPARTAMARVRG